MNQEHLTELFSNFICQACGDVSLLETNIPIATELKKIITTLYNKGASDDDITAYMLQNYSEFIYLKADNSFEIFSGLIWLVPILVSLFFAYIILRIYNKTPKSNFK
ncbi:MAG: cytochrome c-type biogenesis protein CcmH [Alphaproteobacteria bacterium]